MGSARKHNLQKRSEARKLSSVAKASRDSVLLAWRVYSQKMQQATGHSTRQASARAKRKLKYLNVQSMAMKKRPDLFPRGKGKLWWEDE